MYAALKILPTALRPDGSRAAMDEFDAIILDTISILNTSIA